MRKMTLAFIVVALALATYTVSTTLAIPYDLCEARDTALQCTESHNEVFVCGEVLDLGITRQDVEDSMSRVVLRSSTAYSVTPALLVTPDERCVRVIADCILRNTEGCTDLLRAEVALRTVQDLIEYEYDTVLYGSEEFWAYPIETLYFGKGDCEDTSILYASILLAMDIDCVLLDYPNHVAVGVALENPPLRGWGPEHDGRTWWFCETTSSYRTVGEATDISRSLENIGTIGNVSPVMEAMDRATAWLDHTAMNIRGLLTRI